MTNSTIKKQVPDFSELSHNPKFDIFLKSASITNLEMELTMKGCMMSLKHRKTNYKRTVDLNKLLKKLEMNEYNIEKQSKVKIKDFNIFSYKPVLHYPSRNFISLPSLDSKLVNFIKLFCLILHSMITETIDH